MECAVLAEAIQYRVARQRRAAFRIAITTAVAASMAAATVALELVWLIDGFRSPVDFMLRSLILAVAFRLICGFGCSMARTLHEAADSGEALLRRASDDPMSDPEFWSWSRQASRADGAEWIGSLS